jgi:dUTP pyrophosphatase
MEDIMWNLHFVKLNPNAKVPTRGSSLAAGYDLYACIDEDVVIQPHTTAKIGTGLAMKPPAGCFGAIFARSGLATKQGLRPANCVGVCDEDYTGEYVVALHNDTDEVQVVHKEERIAQVVFMPFQDVHFVEVTCLTPTIRGAGGFGSTGL